MQIRKDFEHASLILNRLVEYSKVFDNNNKFEWSHLKNKEDFREVFLLPAEDREPLEQIYAIGRGLAEFMSYRLVAFNDVEYFPTLKSFIDSFNDGCWIYPIDPFKDISQTAKNKSEQINYIWAIPQMIQLFDRQIELLIEIRRCLDSLKDNDLYKWEIGHRQITVQVPEYNRILECVHSVGKMFERLPRTYSGKDEESLRDHILVSLGNDFSGSATGETFNKQGKTGSPLLKQ